MAETRRVEAQLPTEDPEDNEEDSESQESEQSSLSSTVSTLYNRISESLPSREQIAMRASELSSQVSDLFANLTLVDSRAQAAQPSEVPSPNGGGTWRQGENGWQLTGRDGQPSDRYQGQVDNVTRGEDGRAIIKLKDGRTVHENPNGSQLEFNAEGKLAKITTPEGNTRTITWIGDQISAVRSETKTNSGATETREFERIRNTDGTFKDEWRPKGSSATTGWRGRVEVNPENGDYTLTPTDRDPNMRSTNYRADGATDKVLPDGSREVTMANKNVVKYNADGNVTEATFADGSSRRFEWTRNPNASGENDRFSLQSVQVTRDGKQYLHSRTSDGGWQVQTAENGRWGQATRENISFNMNSRTAEYSYTEDGVTTRMTPGRAGSESTGADGSRLTYDNGGRLATATRDGQTREFKYDSQGKPTEINDRGVVWTPAPGGGWRNAEGQTRAGNAFVSPNGDFGFDDNGKKTVIKMDGSEFDRVENTAERSVVERRGNEVRITAGDGSTRQLKTEGNQVVEESVTRNGRTETWTRGERRGEGYVWTNSQTNATEVRNNVSVNDRGQMSVNYPDGRVYTARTNGTERMENAAERSHIEYTGGRPTQVRFGDGRTRDFVYEGDSNVPKSFKVTSPDGSTSEWQRTGDNQWKQPGAKDTDKPWNAEITVARDGTYRIDDRDDKKVTTRTTDGREVTVQSETNARVEKFNNQVTRVTRDGHDLEVVRNREGAVTELRDHTNNRLYKKEGDRFNVSVLDADKPYTAPDALTRGGTATVDERGTVMFTANDGTRMRQELGGELKPASGPEYLRDLVDNSTGLDDAAKTRFRASLEAIGRRTDIDQREKNACYDEMIRLMEHDGNDGPFNRQQRHELVDQTAWMIANPTRNEQGQNPNCQVTDIRTSVLMSQPSAFARMMSEVGRTGTFRTHDGTTITPPASSMQRRPGSEEATFPPEPSTRTWAGKIWDVTTSNVYWNRATRTPRGETVAAGSLVYEENPADNRRDAGTGVFKYWEANGSRWRQQINAADGSLLSYPGMTGPMMMDAYKQITGRDQTDRFIGHTRLGVANGNGVRTISSADELHTALESGPWPKIIQIHTSHPWVHNDSDNGAAGGSGGREGGEHVVVITGYDARTRRVSIDNSWHPDKDRLEGDRRITLDQLYAASAGRYQRPVQQQPVVQQQQLYYSNGRYYYR